MSLQIRDVTVRFGAVTALHAVSLVVQPGRIAAVIGPNGSGKTTLFNSVSGLVRPLSGQIMLDGRRLDGLPAHRRVAAGIARTFQTPRFDQQMSVETALLCGFYPRTRAGMLASLLALPAVLREEERFRVEGLEILAGLGLSESRGLAVGKLPMGFVRLLEVARAIAARPKFLLLDEPAAGLTMAEQAMLAATVRKLAAGGVGVLLVEHNFGLVKQLAEDILVLDRGRELVRGTAAAVEADPRFADIYLGRGARAEAA